MLRDVVQFIFFTDIAELHRELNEKRKQGVLLTSIMNRSRGSFLKEKEKNAAEKVADPEDILAELDQ